MCIFTLLLESLVHFHTILAINYAWGSPTFCTPSDKSWGEGLGTRLKDMLMSTDVCNALSYQLRGL